MDFVKICLFILNIINRLTNYDGIEVPTEPSSTSQLTIVAPTNREQQLATLNKRFSVPDYYMHFFFCQSRLSSWLDYRTSFISFLHITPTFISFKIKESLPGAGDTLLHAFCDSPIEKKKEKDVRLQTKICVIIIFWLIFLLCQTNSRLFIRTNILCNHVISQSYAVYDCKMPFQTNVHFPSSSIAPPFKNNKTCWIL